MAFVLIIVGVYFLIASVRGTTTGPNGLFALLQADFTGADNFLYWMAAILLIGAVGYIPKARPLSTAFLVLVVTVLFLKNANTGAPGGGFFSQLQAGLASTTTAPTSNTAAPSTSPSIFSQFLSKIGLGSSTASAPASSAPVSANPSVFPPPALGTAPEPTLSQLGIGTLPVN